MSKELNDKKFRRVFLRNLMTAKDPDGKFLFTQDDAEDFVFNIVNAIIKSGTTKGSKPYSLRGISPWFDATLDELNIPMFTTNVYEYITASLTEDQDPQESLGLQQA